MQGLDQLWLRNWTLRRLILVWIVALVGATALLWLQRRSALGAYEDAGFWLLIFLGIISVTLPARWAYDHLLARVERREERLRDES